ncbi:MAG: universal stress protein [Euryarchaeota archaeon]|nr:universal stress protein [Euryarchaeota archaeon]
MINRILFIATTNPRIRDAIHTITSWFPFAEYHIIEVVKTPAAVTTYNDMYIRELERIADKAMNEMVKEFYKHGIDDVTTYKTLGISHKEILKYAREKAIDMIVIPTTLLRKHELRLSSTARGVIARSTIPLFIYTPKAYFRESVRVILNPTTCTRAGFAATVFSIKLAKQLHAKVKILKMVEGHEWYVEDAKDIAKKFEVNVEIMETTERTPEKILEMAEDSNLIVATRARPGIAYKLRYIVPSWSIGRLEEEVIKRAPVPLILTP